MFIVDFSKWDEACYKHVDGILLYLLIMISLFQLIIIKFGVEINKKRWETHIAR